MPKGVPTYPYAERATQYARNVVRGKVKACLLVKLACKRHLDDLKRQNTSGFPYLWSKPAANRVCEFAQLMVHVKGEWAGKPITLEDWQCFSLAVPMGWIRLDGTRRFREVYEEVPRKNAKSTKAGILGDYLTFADGEAGAEGYSGATGLEQALHTFKSAWQMVQKNPEFKEELGLDLGGTVKNPGPIHRLSDGSSFRAVVGDPGDGASPHVAIIDEYHEHPTPVLYDTMKTGMGARRQPLLFTITTAGVNTSHPCFELRSHAVRVLKGTIKDEQFFALIYTLDEKDDWKDFSVWPKANPNFGVSVKEEFLRGQHNKAMNSAAEQNIILTKHLNLWMNAGKSWMNMAKWAACARPELKLEDLAGKRAWLALDLASKVDIAARVAVVELDADLGLWALFCRSYMPQETVDLPHNAHLRQWRDQGHLTVTDGARTDFGVIEDDIKRLSEILAVQELAYDPKEATYLIQGIQKWASFECVEIAQAAVHMSEPMKEMEGLIYDGKLLHDDNPVMNWMMGNVVLKSTAKGPVKYFYPTKDSLGAKIDGPVAAIMALKRALVNVNTASVYEERGLILV
jgi:phage terminase large subunit-like protein